MKTLKQVTILVAMAAISMILILGSPVEDPGTMTAAWIGTAIGAKILGVFIAYACGHLALRWARRGGLLTAYLKWCFNNDGLM